MGIETAIIAASIAGATTLAGTAMTNASAEDNAEKQMDFQQYNADTAHQREVKDLRAAGLNPILSAGGSGAASPGGVSAPVLNALGDASSAAITNFSALQSSRQIDPLLDKTRSETKLNDALSLQAGANATSALAGAGLTKAKTSQARYGYLGNLLGSNAADAASSIFSKLTDVISGVNVNSAKKVRPYSSGRPSSSQGTWSRQSDGSERFVFN